MPPSRCERPFLFFHALRCYPTGRPTNPLLDLHSLPAILDSFDPWGLLVLRRQYTLPVLLTATISCVNTLVHMLRPPQFLPEAPVFQLSPRLVSPFFIFFEEGPRPFFRPSPFVREWPNPAFSPLPHKLWHRLFQVNCSPPFLSLRRFAICSKRTTPSRCCQASRIGQPGRIRSLFSLQTAAGFPGRDDFLVEYLFPKAPGPSFPPPLSKR